jgi:methylated-DNA-[protein]-cysteine S-methyltransferase
VTLSRTRLESPVGRLDLVASDEALVAVLWERDRPDRVRLEPLVEAVDHPILSLTARQLGEYFAGERRAFDIPLEFRGPEFQKSVWQALLTIPFGETRTYGQIAQQIGRPTASRAVGAANGANPISIIAPCHRVIGADGSLTGFAGGMENKRLLLNLEGAGHSRQDDLFV